MTRQKIYYLVFLWSLFLLSCVDDKGNYDYLEVDDIRIDEPYYVEVNAKEPLVIKPKFAFASKESANRDDFTYEWKIGENIVGTDSILDLPSVDLELGNHKGMFSVISKATNIRYVKTFTVVVNTKYAMGWLVLYDNGNESDLVFLKGKQVYNYDTYGYDWIYTAEDNVYYKMNGEFLPAGCKKLVDHGYKAGDKKSIGPGGVTIIHKGVDGGIELNGASLTKDYTIRELFLEEELPAGFEVKDIVYSGTGIYLLGEDGRLYSGRYVDKVFWSSRLSHLQTKYQGENLMVDHFIPTEFHQSSFVWMMYSKDQKKFLSVYDDDSNIDDPAFGEIGGVNDPEFWLSGTFMENPFLGNELPDRCDNFVMLDNMTMEVVASGYMSPGWGVHRADYLLILRDKNTGEFILQRHEDQLDRYTPASVVTPLYSHRVTLPVTDDALFLINAVGDHDVFFASDGVIYGFNPDLDANGLKIYTMDDTYRGKKITTMEFNNDASRLGVGFSDGTVVIYKKPTIGDMGDETRYKPVEWFHEQFKGPILDIVFKNAAEVQGNLSSDESGY